MDNPIIGSMKASESEADTIAPAAPPCTYLGIARSLMPGINLLAENPSVSGLSLSMLCAHALECLLKAFLSKDGNDDELRKLKSRHNLRHNLRHLWSIAAARGLEVSEQPPAWVEQLSEVHDAPYFLRYSTGVHGIVTPGVQPMVDELNELSTLVKDCLQ